MKHKAFVDYFTTVADNIDIPLIIYNVPKFTGVDIDASTVGELSANKNIIGLKNSSENIAHLTEIISSTPSDFTTLVGTASILYSGLSVGASGGILALANIAPDECVKIQNLFEQGKFNEALGLQKKMLPVNKAITAKYGVAGLKAAMDKLGYFGGEPRKPLCVLNNSELDDLFSILEKAELLK